MKNMQRMLMYIIVLGIVLSTCISGITSLMSFTSVGKERSRAILSRELELTSSYLDEMCMSVEDTVEALSSLYMDYFPGLDALREDKGKEYIDATKNMAMTFAAKDDYICAIYYRFNPEILNPKGGFFISKMGSSAQLLEAKPTDLSQYARDDDEHVAWFYGPLDAGKAIWVDQYMNLNNEILTLTYAKPLYTKDGTFIGVVGADIDMKKMYDQISKIRIYDTGFAAMLSKTGEVQYSPKRLLMEEEQIGKITSSATSQELQYSDKQKTMTALSQKLRYGDYLLVIIANEDLYSLEERVAIYIILVTLSVSLAIIATVTGILNKLFYNFGTDTLTRTKNRSAYMEESLEIDSKIRSGHKLNLTLVIFDINGPKQVNDEIGHAAGDELIQNAATLIMRRFTLGTLYRVGGDEFVFLSRRNNETVIRYLFEKFQKEMEEAALDYDLKKGTVIVSSGMATYCEGSDTCFEDIFRRADQQMYQNKAGFYKTNKLLDRRQRGPKQDTTV